MSIGVWNIERRENDTEIDRKGDEDLKQQSKFNIATWTKCILLHVLQ